MDVAITVVVTVLAGVLVVGNATFALLAVAGPDGCDQVSCEGNATLAAGFLAFAAIGAIATVGTWVTAGLRRRAAWAVLSTIAVSVPFLVDVVAASTMSSWWT